ncbi:DinB family protein [Frankia sp. AiPs1]|uniref:DinB family protein n=1 Tax=Frankia sp. AiPa1 TaxID=573492 RepID=UPI00202AE8A8|nr:DinB family protein [Frankia sp. AiPa1]MCL9761980.1 DinB family protein [Frankia sp. AiPa1]
MSETTITATTPTTTTPAVTTPAVTEAAERAELLAQLAGRRRFLRYTVEGLDDEQAARRPTASALTLGGLIKHVAAVEHGWLQFILHGPVALEGDPAAREDEFRLLPGETLAGVLDQYEAIARRTEEIINTEITSLAQAHPLPKQPWFPPNTLRSARTVLMHLIGETAQHSGHADILRESIDGRRTMG